MPVLWGILIRNEKFLAERPGILFLIINADAPIENLREQCDTTFV
jgi:hypothetical protein